MGLHPLRLLAAAVLLVAATLAGAPGVSAQTVVPADWALKPSGVSGGEQFRLLFITSTTRNAESTDIANYNTFVQGRAAAGHQAIRSHSSGFRVVGCTEAVDARDNTSTTYTSTDKGVPIYWLGGNKVADEYQDFYDASWDDEANPKNESGGSRSVTNDTRPFTGCRSDGTESFQGEHGSEALGKNWVELANLNGPGSALSGGGRGNKDNPRPFYGLSQVFQVSNVTGKPGLSGFPRVGDVLTASVGDIADADGLTGARYEYQWVRVDGTRETDISLANGTTYRLAGADLGKTVKVRVSFTDDAGSAESVTSAAFPDGGVLAKAVCKAPTYTGGRQEILKGEMGIGETTGIHGFSGAGLIVGRLTNRQFMHGGEPRTIDQIFSVQFPGVNRLQVTLNALLAQTEHGAINDSRLTVHVCDQGFGFGASNNNRGTTYTWTLNEGLNWSTYATRTVRLSYDDVKPTLVSSKVDGAKLKLTFSESLFEVPDMPAGAFAVEVNGSAVSLAASNPVVREVPKSVGSRSMRSWGGSVVFWSWTL